MRKADRLQGMRRDGKRRRRGRYNRCQGIVEREACRRSELAIFTKPALFGCDNDGVMLAVTDLVEFIKRHSAHGTLNGDVTDVTGQGYSLTVACACGVTFTRWMNGTDAASHLVLSTLLTTQN